jgi:two-component system, cell cycle sensor histidine kinase and response regulator CckA
MPTILLADDEPVILKVLEKFLSGADRRIVTASTGEEALRLARLYAPIDIALVDKNFGDASGVQVARELKAIAPETEVILVTGYASVESAIEAVQIGVYDYVTKPIENFDALRLKVTNALEKVRLGREHRAMAARLEESEARYRQLFASVPDAIVVFEVTTERIVEANPAASSLFGHAREELLQLTLATLLAPPRPLFLGASALVESGSTLKALRRSGEVFPADVRLGDLALGGRALRTLTFRDVSTRERLEAERRAVEEQLRQAQKMEAMSRLASGLGHDLGNMLAVVLSYVEELAAGTHGELRKDLETVLGAAERASHLVKQMMTFSRKGAATPAIVAVNASIDCMSKLLRPSLGQRVKLVTELAAEPWPVRIDPSQLDQVLVNLAVNARDAMPDGGRLVVRTENVVFEQRQAGHLDGAPGQYVQLSVSDTGTGMSQEVKDRVFEPFFTTKEAGKGTGLGLAVTYGIVAQAGGTILVESAPGRGSTFRVLLPRAAPERARSAGTPAP